MEMSAKMVQTWSSPTAPPGRWAPSASSARSRSGRGRTAYPPQPMVSQIRAVLERYEQAGGDVAVEMFEGSAHGPHIDASERWRAPFYDFISD